MSRGPRPAALARQARVPRRSRSLGACRPALPRRRLTFDLRRTEFDSNNNHLGFKYNQAPFARGKPLLSTIHRHMSSWSAHLEQSAKSLTRDLEGEAHFDAYQRALYSSDASMYQVRPLGVVWPKHAADIVATVQWCGEHQVPLVPRGSGTSLSGQSIGPGLVLDCSRYLNRVLDIDPKGATAQVEPGVVLDELNRAASKHGLQFGPEVATSSRANLGGMIGNNSAGARSIVHGKTVDHVLELETVLADGTQERFAPLTRAEWSRQALRSGLAGEIYRTVPTIIERHRSQIIERFPSLVRRVSGYNLDEFVPQCGARLQRPPLAAAAREAEARRYPGAEHNLAKLLVGAEGTLACITGARLNLVPIPAARGLVVAEFDSLAAAVDAVGPSLVHRPSAVEIFDRMILELAATNLEYRHYLDFVVGRPDSLVLVEVCDDSPAAVQRRLEALADELRARPGVSHVLATSNATLAAHIWACRKAALPLLMAIPGQRKPLAFVEDTAVDPSRLPEFVARFRQILSEAGTDGAFYGHASVGVLHIRPLIDTRQPDDLARMRTILDHVSDLVLEFGGAMSGEHGDGMARSYLNEKLFGSEVYQAFGELKAAFDPRGLFNPGKIVDGPPPTENLRHPPGERALPVETRFDFSSAGGLLGAAAACNGSGVCRKLRGGTMCPSYMATREEEHSTRGRANALRLVLTGALPASELTGPRLKQTYDLCLQCKGCKAECPTGVDVAKLKAEMLYQYQRQHGLGLGDRLLGNVARVNRLGSALAPVSNWVNGLPGAAWLRERWLGIDRRRSVPSFARHHFGRWFASRPAPPPGGRGPVVLLDDCLTSYCEPAVNRSAVLLLESQGYEVHLAGLECCGRALISKGMLDQARSMAQANLERLLPWAERGVAIVGTEPSCLLTLVDEYPDLVPGPAALRVAQAAKLWDTHWRQSEPPGRFRAAEQPLLLHGHCHQKAIVGLGDLAAVLEQVPGAEIQVVDSGCCGMAGSFGYEHYELSRAIGERVLLPAARAHRGQVLAPGFSCRQQMAHLAQVRSWHPVEWLAGQLTPRERG